MFIILILILTTAITDYLKINLFSIVFIERTYVWHTTTFLLDRCVCGKINDQYADDACHYKIMNS